MFCSKCGQKLVNQDRFCPVCGTPSTTPSPETITADWPKPWLYSREGLLLLATVRILIQIWKQFGNPYTLPNIIFIGSLALPAAVLIFFFEMNVPRNISIFKVIKIFLLGGAGSLFVTLIGFSIAPEGGNAYIYPFVIGIVEETGKAVIAAYAIKKMQGRKYLLNGILLGGAVGAGFAVFESAGYAMYYGLLAMLQTGQGLPAFYMQMMNIIKLRAFLSPGGHVAWAAVSGFAIILALQGEDFRWNVLLDSRFLRIYWIPIVLHGVWDTPLTVLGIPHLVQILLTLAIWVVLLVFISRGLKEVSEIKPYEEVPEAVQTAQPASAAGYGTVTMM